jgi:hypothetical protein
VLRDWSRPSCTNSFFLWRDVKELQLNRSLPLPVATCRGVFRQAPEEHPLLGAKVKQRELGRTKRRLGNAAITYFFEMLAVFLQRDRVF